MKKPVKKLTIKKETLRNLSPREMGAVAGALNTFYCSRILTVACGTVTIGGCQPATGNCTI